MDTLSDAAIAAIISWSPLRKTAEWTQQATATVLQHWEVTSTSDFNTILQIDAAMGTEYTIEQELGSFGGSVPSSIVLDTDAELDSVLHRFQVEWLMELKNRVRGCVSSSPFTPTEFVLFVGRVCQQGCEQSATDITNLSDCLSDWMYLQLDSELDQNSAAQELQTEFQSGASNAVFSASFSDLRQANLSDLPLTTQQSEVTGLA